MYKKSIIIVMGLIMALIGYWYGYMEELANKKTAIPVSQGIKVGEVLLPFVLESLDGSTVKVGSADKIIVLNFWGTQCMLPENEIQEIIDFSKNNQQKVDYFAIASPKGQKKISEFLNKTNATMQVLLDKEEKLARKFEVYEMPTTVIINKHGMIKHRKVGSMTRNELEGIINSL